jgi:predicted lipid-binding transport protein (Tim44 family)
MPLSPKERADFDEIVLRLRLEDADIGMIAPKRRSFALLISVIAATLVFGLGVALVGHGVLGPILIIMVLLGSLTLVGRNWWRSRATDRRRRR